MQVEPVDEPLGDMGQQQGRDERASADSNASLLSVDTQQITYTLAEFEQEKDEEEDGTSDDSEQKRTSQARQLASKQESEVRGDDDLHRHQQVAPSKTRAHSSGAFKVVPDMRRSSEHKRNDSASRYDDGDELNSNHRYQERHTGTTTATVATTTTPKVHRANGQHGGASDRSSMLSADVAIWNIVQLLKPSSVMDKQIYMSVGALVLSLVLGTCALCFRDEIFDVTHVNAGLILGSVGTLVMCSIIIGTYLTTKWYRRHMHILLVNLATFDLLLALSFVLEPAWKNVGAGVGEGLTCRWLSIVREYLIMCSTTWTMCMALDLYYLMTDPFTSPRVNRRKYQIIAHSSASLAAIIMSASNAFDAPVAVGNFCWVGARREDQNNASIGRNGIWIFIITPVTLSMGANIFVTFVSYGRFRDGISNTLKTRHVLLREGFLTTITVIVYSALLWGVYGGYWVATSKTQMDVLSHLFAFLLSYRGSVAFILWCLYKRPKAAAAKSKLRKLRKKTNPRKPTDPEDSDDENDDAVRPQMNIALLQELVYYTTEGIAKAVRSVSSYSLSDESSCTFTLRPSSNGSSWNDCKFTDFRPLAFFRIRRFFGINEDDYLSSLANCTTPKVSEGASGSFMFYSKDRSYIVKSLTSQESSFLHSFLDEYVSYMTSQSNTFLTRFLGSYCIVLYGKKAHFVVMENVFDIQHGISIHQRYDIKGSWIDRNAQKAKRGSEATCRHCNLTFRCGVGRSVCPNRAGCHEPNVVLKDMDLTTKLRFGKIEGKKLVHQLKSDSTFLCDQGIMDYSLLLGVIEVSYQVNQQNILTRDGSIFLENITTETRSENYSTNEDISSPGGGVVPPLRERIKQSTQCLRTSEVVIGPGFYYIGLIDILQTWDMSKRFERFVKTVILRKDPDGISAMAPKPYRNRFHKKLDEIIHLGHNSIAIPSPRHRFGSGTDVHGFDERADDEHDNDNMQEATQSMIMMQGRPTNVLHGVPSLSYLGDLGSERDGEGSAAPPPPPPMLQGQVRRGSVFHSAIKS